jgi:hypothetical protein
VARAELPSGESLGSRQAPDDNTARQFESGCGHEDTAARRSRRFRVAENCRLQLIGAVTQITFEIDRLRLIRVNVRGVQIMPMGDGCD